MKFNSKDITKILINDITQRKYKPNEKLPSEKNLEIKYGVSRAITNKVFRNLKEMDLVYSVAHKGYFVSEFFSNITISNKYKYNINKIEVKNKEKSDFIKTFMNNKKINLKTENSIIQKMYNKEELVIISEIILSKYVHSFSFNKINIKSSITDQLSNLNILKSVNKIGLFEKDDIFGEKLQMVEYKIYYGNNELLGISRNVIKHKIHNYIKKEIAI